MSRDNILSSQPRGYTNPVNLRVSAVLELASAWDPTPVESFSTNAQFLNLVFTYTRGGAAGAFEWQVWTSPYTVAANVPAGAQEWSAPAIYASGAVVAGADTTSLLQREISSYTATGAPVETFYIAPIALRGVVSRIRIRARESGNAGAPGTLQITGVMV